MAIDFAKKDRLYDYRLKEQRLAPEFTILANATPSLKQERVDIPSVMYLRSQGRTSLVDAIETLVWTSPFDSGGGSPGNPAMGTSRTYAVLGASTVTNTGSSVLTGNLGLNPGSSVTGFPPGTFSGSLDVDNAAAIAAQNSALIAYNDLHTRSSTVIPSILDGQTLTPGVYSFTSGSCSLAASGNGTLTLNGAGVYVIQTASTLTTGAGGIPTITLSGGATASQVYWAIGSSATINVSGSGVFQGNIIANTSVTVDGGSVNGSLIALNAAVTIAAATNITTQALSGSGNSLFGVLLTQLGNVKRVKEILVTEQTSFSSALVINKLGVNGLTPNGNIAFEINATGLHLDTQSPTFFIRIEYQQGEQ